MALTNNPNLLGLFQKYGSQWDPSFRAEQDGEQSSAAFALKLSKYAQSILVNEVFREEGSAFTTEFFLIENRGINGFATKISEESENYAIAIYSGTIMAMHRIFSLLSYIATLQNGSSTLKDRKSIELRWFSLYFSSLFLVYHEFSHVYRGHLNYSAARGLGNAAWMEGERHAERQFESQEYADMRLLLECDADACAGRLLVGEIQVTSQALGQVLNVDHCVIRDDLMVLAATAIHFQFCILDNQFEAVHPHYPAPAVRSAIVHANMISQLVEEGLDANATEEKVARGVTNAERLARALKLEKGAYDFETAVASWEATYGSRLSKMNGILPTFYPTNRGDRVHSSKSK